MVTRSDARRSQKDGDTSGAMSGSTRRKQSVRATIVRVHKKTVEEIDVVSTADSGARNMSDHDTKLADGEPSPPQRFTRSAARNRRGTSATTSNQSRSSERRDRSPATNGDANQNDPPDTAVSEADLRRVGLEAAAVAALGYNEPQSQLQQQQQAAEQQQPEYVQQSSVLVQHAGAGHLFGQAHPHSLQQHSGGDGGSRAPSVYPAMDIAYTPNQVSAGNYVWQSTGGPPTVGYDSYYTHSPYDQSAGNGGPVTGPTTLYRVSPTPPAQAVGPPSGGSGSGSACNPFIHSPRGASLDPQSDRQSINVAGGGGGALSQTTRASPATIKWLLQNYETAEGVSLPRNTLYSHYLMHCNENRLDPVNAASFGKLIRSVFLGLRTRRLGTRGNSKYHYYGIRIKPESVLNRLNDVHQPQPGLNDSQQHTTIVHQAAMGIAPPMQQQQHSLSPGRTAPGLAAQQQGGQHAALRHHQQQAPGQVGGCSGGRRSHTIKYEHATPADGGQPAQLYAGGGGGAAESHQQQQQQQQQHHQLQQQHAQRQQSAMQSNKSNHYVCYRAYLGTGTVPNIKPPNECEISDNELLVAGVQRSLIVRFVEAYRDHCEAILCAILELELANVAENWRTFWQPEDCCQSGDEPDELSTSGSASVHALSQSTGHEPRSGSRQSAGACGGGSYHGLSQATLFSLCTIGAVQRHVRAVDNAFYQVLVDVLIPDVLRSIPSAYTQLIRNFAKSLQPDLQSAMCGAPDGILKIKMGSVRSLAVTLRRYTSLNHLSQAARDVLTKTGQIHQMLHDISRVDFASVHEQATWACRCDAKFVHQLVNEFKANLESEKSLEEWAQWLETVVDGALRAAIAKGDQDALTAVSKQFLLKWSFYCSMVMRDLTLRSADSFGAFHLIRLLYDEFVFYVVAKRLAAAQGTSTIALMLSASLDGSVDDESSEQQVENKRDKKPRRGRDADYDDGRTLGRPDDGPVEQSDLAHIGVNPAQRSAAAVALAEFMTPVALVAAVDNADDSVPHEKVVVKRGSPCMGMHNDSSPQSPQTKFAKVQ